MAKNIFFEEICRRVRCEAEESFEDEACSALVELNCVNLSIFVNLSTTYSTCICIIKQMKKPKPCITP